MSARLVAEEGILKGLVLPLDEGEEEWVIGRDPDECQLLIEDPAASRRHLLCRNTSQGFLVENLSKTNPVEINEETLAEPRLLKTGDTLRIGSGMFRFFVDSPLSPLALEEAKEEGEEERANQEKLPAEEEKHDSILEEPLASEKEHQFPEINFDVVDMGRWLLKVIGGPNNGAEFSMHPGATYIIGTDPNSCDIVFHDTSVSRQHARLTIAEDETIFIEDLRSRNQTLVSGETIKEKQVLQPNTIVTTGTTSFVVYDREGNMQTIISPLMPSLVKVLQREEKASEKKDLEEGVAPSLVHAAAEKPPKQQHSLGSLLLVAALTGLFVVAAIGTATLFKSEPLVVKEELQPEKALIDALAPYPSIKYSFNKTTGRLVLFGHLLTSQDKTQLFYNLQGMPFIKSIDDSGVIIDEYVWQETNQVINKNPNWRAITIQSPKAGQFVITGTLQNSKQAEQLYEYISNNFPYLDRLEKRVVVEEDILNDVKSHLEKIGILNTQVSYRNGEISIIGGIAANKQAEFDKLVEEFKKVPGVRSLKLQVSLIAPEQAVLNISDRYEVSGFSRIGTNISVVVNGRIITRGDVLDGMTITDIVQGTVFLEKDGVKYRIDFSK